MFVFLTLDVVWYLTLILFYLFSLFLWGSFFEGDSKVALILCGRKD